MFYEIWEISTSAHSKYSQYNYVTTLTQRQEAVEFVTKAIVSGIVITLGYEDENRRVQDAHEFASENI